MVIAMSELKKLQERSSIQKCVNDAGERIDKRIEITVLDDNETYKGFSVVVGAPNTTSWSGRGPLFLTNLVGSSSEVINQILQQLGIKYEEAGYKVLGPRQIDIGMHETAPGIHIVIPNQLSE